MALDARWTLQITKKESIPLNLVIVECNFDSDYQEKTAQAAKIFFNHSIHRSIPQRKKKSIIMFKRSNCQGAKCHSTFVPCSLK